MYFCKYCRKKKSLKSKRDLFLLFDLKVRTAYNFIYLQFFVFFYLKEKYKKNTCNSVPGAYKKERIILLLFCFCF